MTRRGDEHPVLETSNLSGKPCSLAQLRPPWQGSLFLLASAEPLAFSALPAVASADHREKKPSSASSRALSAPLLGNLRIPKVTLSNIWRLTFRVGFRRTTLRAAGTTIRFFC